ncbi:hypothetical protein M2401_001601 [Pseudomonas sp. JUb42]|uniref:hypothetical protein n=1 Tax=Pseudomonas sp. JUb42 TaxID=2940611 RepID=UPI0021671175|nr:hypothetical protein [Pseudomonas sp. JUb42]MCS3467876.1 hypothetical protein [Pseudomonas sp. JUb42]
MLPHTVLRMLGAHSNAPEEKTKSAINRLFNKLAKGLTGKRPVRIDNAEIIGEKTVPAQ